MNLAFFAPLCGYLKLVDRVKFVPMLPRAPLGVVAIVLFLACALSPAAGAGSSSAADDLKVLVCLDGVPYSMLERLRSEGHFAAFRPAARLISTFPAITEIMLTEFFGVDPPPGYGLRYYDRATNSLKGGILNASSISVWFSLYDFVTPMFDRGMVYLWGHWGETDLKYARRLLDRADSGVLMMHMDSTDALMHHERPVVTERWLIKFDRILSDFLTNSTSKAGRNVEVVLFSDHGNDMTRSRRIAIEPWLKHSGFVPSSVIRGDSGVAILPTGLISTGYMYTAHKFEVAQSLSRLEGVEFALYQRDSKVFVCGKNGGAVIEKNRAVSGDRYRYTATAGDPFELEGIIAEMRREGKIDSDGYAADRDWFNATLTHTYPDVVNRAYGGLTSHVQNVGDVLLSLEDGWHCGSKMLSGLMKFQGTHGSLRKGSITGFVISNRRDLPPMRAEEVLDHLGWRGAVASSAARRSVHIRHEYVD